MCTSATCLVAKGISPATYMQQLKNCILRLWTACMHKIGAATPGNGIRCGKNEGFVPYMQTRDGLTMILTAYADTKEQR